jgi:hypothetical protein
MLTGAGTSQFGGDHTLPCGFSVLRNRAGRARHGDAAGEKIGLDHADAQAVADELGLDLDRRHDIRQAEHVDRQSRWHKILSAVALLDREGKQADDAAAVQRLRVPRSARDRGRHEEVAVAGEERLVSHGATMKESAR